MNSDKTSCSNYFADIRNLIRFLNKNHWLEVTL